jgi:ketosteroid isomerase-like protein
MTDPSASPALQTALAYYTAWTSKDMDGAMSVIAEDVVCESPSGRLEGAEAVRDFMEPFTRILVRAELIAAFGDEQTALLMYDTDTQPVPHAPAAECHTVNDGKITHLTIIFDRQPFTEARQAAG